MYGIDYRCVRTTCQLGYQNRIGATDKVKQKEAGTPTHWCQFYFVDHLSHGVTFSSSDERGEQAISMLEPMNIPLNLEIIPYLI